MAVFVYVSFFLPFILVCLSIRTYFGGMYSGRCALSLRWVYLIVLLVSTFTRSYDSGVYLLMFMLHSDDDILMQLPELYRYGREHYWYSTKLFAIYMFDAVYQVSCLIDVSHRGF